MVAESCESIIINKHTPTNTSLSITVHRITGSNEATTLLHRPGVGIFYNDVRLITNYWAGCITLNHRVTLSPGFSSNKPIHITFGNSDGRQQTITGGQTTHHTTGTIFQVKSDNNNNNNNNNNTEYPGESDILDDDEETDFGEFKIRKKRASPPRIPNFNDEFAKVELLNLSLERDIAWVI